MQSISDEHLSLPESFRLVLSDNPDRDNYQKVAEYLVLGSES